MVDGFRTSKKTKWLMEALLFLSWNGDIWIPITTIMLVIIITLLLNQKVISRNCLTEELVCHTITTDFRIFKNVMVDSRNCPQFGAILQDFRICKNMTMNSRNWLSELGVILHPTDFRIFSMRIRLKNLRNWLLEAGPTSQVFKI